MCKKLTYNTIKILMVLFLFITTQSCGINGPNYNSGRSHNETLGTRHKVVNKEDKRMKNSMIKARGKASKGKKIKKNKYKRTIHG
tara:strand:+ start:2261 stop:2515 length:255 start_codon:yes stop_codon:yes gene_type:complete